MDHTGRSSTASSPGTGGASRSPLEAPATPRRPEPRPRNRSTPARTPDPRVPSSQAGSAGRRRYRFRPSDRTCRSKFERSAGRTELDQVGPPLLRDRVCLEPHRTSIYRQGGLVLLEDDDALPIGRYGSARGWRLVDRLRRVDPRIWDALLALGVVGVGLLAFALRAHRPDEPPALFGFALVVVAGVSSPGVGGLRSSSRRSCPRRSRPRRCSATGPSSSRCCGSRCTPPLRTPSATGWSESCSRWRCSPRRDQRRRTLGPRPELGRDPDRPGRDVRRPVPARADDVQPPPADRPRARGRDPRGRRRRTRGDRRELHDVVAHHMSVMVVQAGAARAVSGSDPAATAEALRQIEASGRTGLAEMRRLLEVLKAENDGDGGRRSRASPASTSSSTRCGPRACRSKPSSKERRDRCRPASTCPPTASSRRRSPTPSGMPAERAPGRRAL